MDDSMSARCSGVSLSGRLWGVLPGLRAVEGLASPVPGVWAAAMSGRYSYGEAVIVTCG